MCVCGAYVGVVTGFYEEGNTGMHDATTPACACAYAPGCMCMSPGMVVVAACEPGNIFSLSF